MKDKTPTRYPGVFRLDQATYWIRAKVVDPRTGKNREIDRILDGVTAHEAAQKRDALINEIKQSVQQAKKVRVGEFAKSWIESKTLKLDSTTARTYADALENHILPALGNYYYDALLPTDVQRWIDDALLRGWTSEKRGSKQDKTKTVRRAYSRDTVKGSPRDPGRTTGRDASDLPDEAGRASSRAASDIRGVQARAVRAPARGNPGAPPPDGAPGRAPARGDPGAEPPDVSEHEQRFELLADLGAMIAGEVELDDLLATFAARVARALGADRATLWLIDNATGEIRSQVATLPELPELRVPPGHGVVGHVARTGELMNNRDVGADPRWAEAIAQRIGYPVTSMLTAPIVRRGQIRGVLQVLNQRDGAFTARDEEFIRVLAEQIGRALDYTTLRGDDASRGLTLRGRFNHVIGRSPEMAAVYEMIVRAAQTDATVLLHGETGTGKGLLARAIHVNSARREAGFVHVDCTTLPAALVESELFGHERGAYTGADSRVIGKVEAAGRGTLFLDEIGELPLPLQGKLLRFVQERRFERVGGRETLAADVRIVAATNRDLAALAAAGQFRSDLYFRLRVIEIEIPPLRARGRDDVADLAAHFVDQFARRHRKAPLRIAAAALPALTGHTWPGNVRELENAIERAVVLCQGETITVKDLGLEPRRAPAAADAPAHPGTAALPAATSAPGATPAAAGDDVRLPANLALDEAERRYARAVLERCAGNQSAAARLLGISRNKLARLLKA